MTVWRYKLWIINTYAFYLYNIVLHLVSVLSRKRKKGPLWNAQQSSEKLLQEYKSSAEHMTWNRWS